MGLRLLVAAMLPTLLALASADPREGRRIYFGLNGAGQSCASCHGVAGQGGNEGGTAIPEIRSLFSGRSPYAEPGRLCRALISGMAPDGRALSRSMPRFSISGEDCRALVAYLAGREDRAVPGVEDARIVVRMAPTPALPAHRRWHDVLARRFDAVNQAGGVFGRRIELVEGVGPAAFLVALQPADGLDDDTGVRIALRDAGNDPATRGVEAGQDSELAALFGYMKTLGTEGLVWIDDQHLGPGIEDVRLLAIAESLEVQDRDHCAMKPADAVIILSAATPLPPGCANATRLYVSLRGVPIDLIPVLLRSRAAGLPIHAFAALPLDDAFSVVPALVADAIVETSRHMTARPSEPRMLVALDTAWRKVAEDRRSLFAGVALQQLTWPALAASQSPEWKPVGR
ncbi:MAG: c-type cytochrome [Candidatus Sphingomonas phytovorans]|nr:c-type cytochrome [Sphingomonas sp.]WEK00152.1 MAG: c-type cytochrome [Sphingomonas sp.]